MISAPAPLTEVHALDAFDSGVPTLDEWLKRWALRNQVNGSSRTYVICDGVAVVGYYCLAAGAVAHATAPSSLRRNRPDPIPVFVLGRLAIHREHQQGGVGTALLQDAILRTVQTSSVVGISALLVHAISEQARRFYVSRGFVESPIQPMTLCLPLASVEKALREA